jgi:anti-sigma factor (TIGR02949 family)
MKWPEELRRLLHRLRKQPPEEEPGGITCQDAAERLFEWLDGELDEDMQGRVGTHLEACARCYPRLLFEKSFREAVTRAARDEEAPEELRARILKDLEAEGFGS